MVRGVVPKNKFGNIEVHVPSMVPAGGAHVADERAARAAFILGVDYSPALTGFSFRGRQGTAVLNGAVVAAEAEEAVRAVVAALGDLEREAEAARRTLAALTMWSRMLKTLRIHDRVLTAYGETGKNGQDVKGKAVAAAAAAAEHDGDSDGGGGGWDAAAGDGESDATAESDMSETMAAAVGSSSNSLPTPALILSC